MDRQEYIENILDHFQNPRHKGELHDATVSLMGGNPGCGDIVTMYLKLDADERIVAASFTGEGCTISQAAADILTEMIVGKTLDDVKHMSHEDFVDELGRDVVMSRPKCATLALNTTKAAERKYRAGQRGELPAEPDADAAEGAHDGPDPLT